VDLSLLRPFEPQRSFDVLFVSFDVLFVSFDVLFVSFDVTFDVLFVSFCSPRVGRTHF
jgi:hypothetical protein